MKYIGLFKKDGKRFTTIVEGINFDNEEEKKYLIEKFKKEAKEELFEYEITEEEQQLYQTDKYKCGEDSKPILIPEIEPTLEELKERYINKFKEIRDLEEVKPLKFKDTILDFDTKSRERIMFAIIANEETLWTDANNNTIKLTKADLSELATTIKARTSIVHLRYNNIKNQIQLAKNIDELEAIKWEENY